ncbi:hypothetical protein ATCC90586_003215 [Pythium insidiosum]|nr:hypothetical protein ATCC90586_003215 [Pythium insidiosum]
MPALAMPAPIVVEGEYIAVYAMPRAPMKRSRAPPASTVARGSIKPASHSSFATTDPEWTLPDSVRRDMLAFFTPEDLLALEQVDRSWREAVASSGAWRSVSMRQEPESRMADTHRVLSAVARRHGAQVRRLELVNCAIPDQVFADVGAWFSALEVLVVSGCKMLTDVGLAALVSASTQSVREVRAVKCPLLTNDALAVLNAHHAQTLRRVDLSYCRLVTSDGVETLVRGARDLEAIAFKGCPKVNDAAAVAVARECRESLRSLQLGGSGNISDAALEALAEHCPNLKTLDIARSNPFGMGRGGVSDGGLMHLLAKCRRVESLVLRGQGRLSANVLVFMSFNCEALESLDIGGCRGIVQNTTLLCGALKRMARLEQLSVSFCGGVVDDEHVSSIVSECPQLKKFDVDGEAIVAPRQSGHNERRLERDVLSIRDDAAGLTRQIHVPSSDIDASIGFSFFRCAFSIFSLLLVLTDIPRTGLTVDLSGLPSVIPGVIFSYGPHNYPTATFTRNESTGLVAGLRRGNSLAAARLWAYKFDTLSIPQRAMALHLNVTAYPPCVLYRGACEDPELLPLKTAFGMLDGLVSALRRRYFAERGERRPFAFVTKGNWIDRLHHTIIQFAWRRQDDRLHVVHHFDLVPWRDTSTSGGAAHRICGNHHVRARSRRDTIADRHVHRPQLCDLMIPWPCSYSSTALPTARRVSLGTHIDLRVQEFRERNPELRVDLTVITTQNLLTNERKTWLPKVFLLNHNMEITTLMRARRCRDGSTGCETVVIDDYRYERSTVETNVDEWRPVIAVLRGTAQIYVWLRLAFAWLSCFYVRSRERKHRDAPLWRQILVAWRTFFTIPSHVLIYGSWFPILGYSMAQILDSSITHTVQNGIWSTSNGILERFEFIAYTLAASLQMRNIWLFALIWKLVLWTHRELVSTPRGRQWTPMDGVVGFRGLFVGAISSLTVFSFLRAIRFRDTDVISVHELARHMPLNSRRFPPMHFNMSEFGCRLDFKTGLIATGVFLLASLVLQSLVVVLTDRPTHLFLSRSNYVPLSASTLWPTSLLDVFWFVPVRPIGQRNASFFASLRQVKETSSWKIISIRLLENAIFPKVDTSTNCMTCRQPVSLVHWRRTQGCPQHQHIFRLDKRPREVWSVIRLLNIGLLSDPAVLLRLHVFVRPL